MIDNQCGTVRVRVRRVCASCVPACACAWCMCVGDSVENVRENYEAFNLNGLYTRIAKSIQ